MQVVRIPGRLGVGVRTGGVTASVGHDGADGADGDVGVFDG